MNTETPDDRPPRFRPLVWIAAFASVVVVVILVLPAIQAAREAARRTEVRNKLKQIVLGTQNYGNTYGANIMPAGGTFREDGTPLQGWPTQLVPFLESQGFFDRIDQSIPWDDPSQVDHFMHYKMRVFLDPSIAQQETPDGLPVTHFAANEWLLNRGRQLHMSEIIDFEHTMLIGDAFGDFRPMGEPFNWRDPTVPFQTEQRQFGHVWRKVTHVALLDGGVAAINSEIDAKVFARLAGAPELRPSPEDVARPTEPYRLKTKEYWRYLYAGTDGRGKGSWRVSLKLSPDGRQLEAEFYDLPKSAPKTLTWLSEFRPFVKSQPIEHVVVSGELYAADLTPFLQLPSLKLLTISEATIEGDKAAALRKAGPTLTVD